MDQEKIYNFGKSVKLEYLGGHPDIQKAKNILLSFKENYAMILIGITRRYRLATIDKITAEFKTEEQISKDVTLTRLLLGGVLAFGLKKKRKIKQDYLVLKYEDDVLGEINIIFGGKDVQKAYKEFSKFKRFVLGTNKVNSNQNNSLNDLEKLAELKDKGIITEEEFAAKKKQILGI